MRKREEKADAGASSGMDCLQLNNDFRTASEEVLHACMNKLSF